MLQKRDQRVKFSKRLNLLYLCLKQLLSSPAKGIALVSGIIPDKHEKLAKNKK